MVLLLSDMLRALTYIANAQQGTLDLAVHHERLVRRRDLRSAALEQGEPQFLLQLLDHPGDRRLRTAEHLPGRRDTACRHHRRKRFQLTQIHTQA